MTRVPSGRESVRGPAIELHDFVLVFGGGSIRARIDWAALTGTEFTVHAEYSASRERLGELTTVWYVSPDGRPAEYFDKGARPVRVGDVHAADPALLDPRRRAVLERMRAAFSSTTEPAVLALPGFRLADGSALLLDGNHRAVAAYQAGGPVRLLLFLLDGPLSPALLPDLAHHTPTPR